MERQGYRWTTGANILIRKYRDDLFLYLFILEVLNNRKGLSNEEINSITNGEYDAEKFYKIIVATMLVIQEGFRKDKNDKAVDAWFDNEALSGKFKNELSINNYFKCLNQNLEIQRCISEHGLAPIWENIREKLNDYTHNNGIKFIKHNLLEFSNKEDLEDCVLSVSLNISLLHQYFLLF